MVYGGTAVLATGFFDPTSKLGLLGRILADARNSAKSTNLSLPAYATALSSSAPTQQTDPDAYQIITQALAAGQTKIHLPGGNYSVSQQVNINNTPNVEIFGDGQNATILRLNDNVYGGSNTNPLPAHVLSFFESDGFHVHDLQIDGNAAANPVQEGPFSPYAMNGINTYQCSNGTVNNCLIHDARYYGISIEVGSNCIVINNTVLNSNSNGIVVSSASTHGSGHQVINNLVNGASEVGISCWEANGALVQGNKVQNITLNNSPTGTNTHVGILAEGRSPCINCTFSNNTVSNISSPSTPPYQGVGMGAGSNGSSNIQFLNNKFQNVYQMMRLTGGVTGITVRGNICRSPTAISDPIVGISAGTCAPPPCVHYAPTGIDIEQNTIAAIPFGMTAFVVVINAGSGMFINNTIDMNGNPINKAITVSPPIKANWVTSPNTINPN